MKVLRMAFSQKDQGSQCALEAIRSAQKGFSLIEIMAALTILGIIVGLVTVNVTGALSQGKVKATKIQISNLASAIEEFNRDCNHYPTTEQGLRVLIEKTSD